MFVLKVSNLDKLQSAIRQSPKIVYGELTTAVRTSLNLIRPIVRGEMPVKTGKMARYVRVENQGLRGTVGPDLDATPYALFVHEGTDPHEIRPRNKKALWWPGAPGNHPWAKVMHPGTVANPFLERAFSQIKSPVEQVFRMALDRAVKRIQR